MRDVFVQKVALLAFICAAEKPQLRGSSSDGGTLLSNTSQSTTWTASTLTTSIATSVTRTITTVTMTTSTTTTTPDKRPIWSNEVLLQNSSAPLRTFYMYRAVTDKVYAPMNVNMANLPGVLWYLHNEVVERTPRKFGITKISRLKVQTRSTQPLWEKGMEFGVRLAFDSGQATGPFVCGWHGETTPKLCQGPFDSTYDVGMHNGSVVGAFEWDAYGYFVGCNKLGSHPFPNYRIYYPGAVWYSLPGPCPSNNYTLWDQRCKERQPGGYCEGTPTGQGNCTWTYENAGEVTVDELVGIRNYTKFLASGRKEYQRWADRGLGWTWWDSKKDVLANEWRIQLAKEAFERKYPNSTREDELPAPECDFNFAKFYDHRAYDPPDCKTAQPGEKCYSDVTWAMKDGIHRHPEWYPDLSEHSSFADFQGLLYHKNSNNGACAPPCDNQ